MEQVQYDRIVSYLRTGSFPSSMTKNEKDSLRRKAKNSKLLLPFHRERLQEENRRLCFERESMFIVHVGNLMMAAK